LDLAGEIQRSGMVATPSSAETVTVRVYEMIDPRTREVRYVGSTRLTMRARRLAHMAETEKCPKNDWLAELKAAGVTPMMHLLQEVSLKKRYTTEQYWITKRMSEGCRLFNRAPQGNLPDNLPHLLHGESFEVRVHNSDQRYWYLVLETKSRKLAEAEVYKHVQQGMQVEVKTVQVYGAPR
jgi:hypothetical protein